MTAVVHVLPTAADEVELLVDALTISSGLEEFLRDPIGYGGYDFADPITLAEFSTCRHHHGGFIALAT